MFGGAGADVFDISGGGFDTAADFSVAESDRIFLGKAFTGSSETDFNGDGVRDTVLSYDGGTLVVYGVTDLSLGQWNGLLV